MLDLVQMKGSGWMDRQGIPDAAPLPEVQIRPPKRPQLLGFRFPEVPGIPKIVDSPARDFVAAAAAGDGDPAGMAGPDWEASLAAMAGELERAEYHDARFAQTLLRIKARREVVGGPVVGDPATARALYYESVGYLSAIRTSVDIMVYIAARRLGVAPDAADKWKATSVMRSARPSKYDSDDVEVLRRHCDWYETLNLYRNCMLHRGWHQQSFGYFSQGDTAQEATNPRHNVMLVPDRGPLAARARPGAWTYNDKRWLDVLLGEIKAGAALVVKEIARVWRVPQAAKGQVPIEDQPNMYLTVPLGRSIAGQDPPVIYVFGSKQAGRAFFSHLRKRGYLLGGQLRATRRMKLANEGSGFLIAYDSEVLGESAEVHLMDVRLGEPIRLAAEPFRPAERCGPVEGTLFFRLPTYAKDVLYLLDVE